MRKCDLVLYVKRQLTTPPEGIPREKYRGNPEFRAARLIELLSDFENNQPAPLTPMAFQSILRWSKPAWDICYPQLIKTGTKVYGVTFAQAAEIVRREAQIIEKSDSAANKRWTNGLTDLKATTLKKFANNQAEPVRLGIDPTAVICSLFKPFHL